jgi:hypothetical protein
MTMRCDALAGQALLCFLSSLPFRSALCPSHSFFLLHIASPTILGSQNASRQGTEFYDAPSKRYVDFPITDVLQVAGQTLACLLRAYIHDSHAMARITV